MKVKFFAFLFLFIASSLSAKNVSNGVLNFERTVGKERVLMLNGDWEFYENQTFSSLGGKQVKIDFIPVPGSWNRNMAKDRNSPEFGCNTYRLMINGLRPKFEYGIFSRRTPAYNARVFVNGKLSVEYGNSFGNYEDCKPSERPLLCRATSDSRGSIELVIQVSNYTDRFGGILTPIIFGEFERIHNIFDFILLIKSIMLGGLFFIFLMNFLIWVLDRSRTVNLVFAAMILAIFFRSGFYGFNVLYSFGLSIPYEMQFKFEYIVLFSPAVFSVLYKNRIALPLFYNVVNNFFIVFTFFLLIIFICIPIRIAIPVVNIALFICLLYCFFALVCTVYAVRKKNYTAACYMFFYIIVASGIVVDEYILKPRGDIFVCCSEISVLLLIVFDTAYLSVVLELLQKRVIRKKAVISEYYLTYRKFVPPELLKFLKKDSFAELSLSDRGSADTTIMMFGMMVVSPDNMQISLRVEFETLNFYAAKIIELIDSGNGIIFTLTSQKITVIFKGGTREALETAYKIRDTIQTMNTKRAEDYYPCILFTVAIHYGQVLCGLVGDDKRIGFTALSPDIEFTEKNCRIGISMNIPTIISEQAVNQLDGEEVRRLRIIGKIKFSEFPKPILLYGMQSSEELENSLESLEEGPCITQLSADKYIDS